MQKTLLTMVAAVFASPALAASGPFFSLANTNFVVLLAFLLFVGFLIYVKVPALLGKKLDERADNIKAELDEARALREEAQTLLASYERKQKDVQAQADRIVAHAKEEANAAAEELLYGAPKVSAPIHERATVLPKPLKQGLDAWLKDPTQRIEPFQPSPTSPLLQANFTQLDQERGDQILVFIEDMSKVTQQAQQMKLAALGRLTAGIAHEIRNPLGAISHAAQLMEESPNLDPGDHQMLGIIRRHSRRVNGIIENVLDLSRRRAANADLIEVAPWLQEFKEDFLQTQNEGRAEAEIILKIDPQLPSARFDKSQIEQVMVNLCDNGLRYSEQHSGQRRIGIHAGATEDGERTYIDVRDQGPGIAPEHRNSVFEPFFTTDKTGTGLGLYLARELCEANQAHLSLVEDNKPGCCFRITFAHPGRMI